MDAIGDGAEQRIGAAERDDTVAALRAHLESGRLTPEEYEDRSVAAGRARTWGEVAPLFADLPDPRPGPVSGHLARATPVSGPGRWLSEGVKQRIMGVTPFAALVLFFTTHTWLWFLAIPAMGALLYGSDRKRRR
ncbi:MAG TPA: DUF1707 domain-containing protein [Kineosporiaceae bacterium]|nr:DUF1707 domain-containing protein [Kineosporiaceae bacterium]